MDEYIVEIEGAEELEVILDDEAEEIIVDLTPQADRRQYRQDIVGEFLYIGKADLTAKANEPYWTITRIEVHLDGTVTVKKASSVKWTDRLTSNYF